MLNRSLLASLAVCRLRKLRTRARHHTLVKSHNLVYYPDLEPAHPDLRAYEMLQRAEASLPWIPRPLYPVGGAAEPLLLYLLIRALDELPVERVLELGAGETTRLLGGWVSSAEDRHAVTFEHDAWWAGRVRDRLNGQRTQVHHLQLHPIDTPAGKGKWYAPPPAEVLPEQGFNLVVVDGPVGVSRFSRYGIVQHLPEWLADDWAVIWDDLHRPADLESFAAFIERLRQLDVPHGHRLLDGVGTVGVVYSPAFTALQHMW